MKPLLIILAAIGTAVALPCCADDPHGERVAADIQKRLPEGWKCTLISEKGKMGHPHGLVEPLFRLDFVNTNLTFNAESRKGRRKLAHPNLRLHFHDVSGRDQILKTIEAESIYSRDIPTLFAENKAYVVVTSPLWVNYVKMDLYAAGVRTKEASEAIAPLVKALKAYFDAKK